MAQISKLAVLTVLMVFAGATKGSLIDDGVFETCSVALEKIPGYDFTTKVLSQCPDLQKLPSDPTLVKTFFVPSNEAIKTVCDQLGIPLEKVLDGEFKTIMCQLLRYHIVNGKYTLDQWRTGQGFKTMYFGAKLTVKAAGDDPEVKPLLGTAGKVEHQALCGESVAYGIDAVLAPFPIAKLSALSG